MLKRELRIPARIRLTNPIVFSNSSLVLKVIKNNQEHSRFRVIVSKKIDKRAVVRNKIRRSFYDAFRELYPQLTDSYDMIAIVKKHPENFDARLLLEDLMRKGRLII
ncbi:MAG: ribonuclease P protein component [Candidatus Bilamarchaeaceae archaeon]